MLAYVAHDVVGQLCWFQAGTMMDGLGLAETTPGPLILVTEFVGFVTAFYAGGLAYGIAGAAIASARLREAFVTEKGEIIKKYLITRGTVPILISGNCRRSYRQC